MICIIKTTGSEGDVGDNKYSNIPLNKPGDSGKHVSCRLDGPIVCVGELVAC